jgi:hypothetical protein
LEQRSRFPDIHNYPVKMSERLRQLRDNLTEQMRADSSGWQNILEVPEALSAELSRNTPI